MVYVSKLGAVNHSDEKNYIPVEMQKPRGKYNWRCCHSTPLHAKKLSLSNANPMEKNF